VRQWKQMMKAAKKAKTDPAPSPPPS
jgi:hypothetical protein